MKRIGLIDIDGGKKFPNLVLMKISAWHKAQGDSVEWYSPWDGRYDEVYISKVFSFSPDYDYVINADHIHRGGSGYCIDMVDGREVFNAARDVKLPSYMEHIYPDYSMYPQLTKDTAYGFLTRGCPRRCGFCIVGDKEGCKSHKVADVKEFWRGQKKITLCDPNILACPDWKELLDQLRDTGASIDFNQGLDIRLMTKEKAELLNGMRISDIHFAWDNIDDRNIILPKLKMFADNFNISPHSHKAVVYTLVNYNSTIEQDLERIYTLRDMGYAAYVMVYDKVHAAPIYKSLQRWCNMRSIFYRVPDFKDYNKKKAKE